MAVGDGAEAAVRSYVAFAKETSFGSYATCTAAMEFLSCGFKTEIDSERLGTMMGNRGITKRVMKDKKVTGQLEQYLHPQESVLLFAAALGGGVVSAAAASTGCYNHTLPAGNFDTTSCSLSFNVRKGSTKTWQYTGGRVNELKLSANVGEVVKASYDFIFKDSTQLANDISAALSISSILPFVFHQGQFRYAATMASAQTSTAQETVIGFELTIKNNLVSGKEARALGSQVLSCLPCTRREVELKVTQRFDTTTAYDRFIAESQGAVELFFQGPAISTQLTKYGMTIDLPKVQYDKADVEIKDANSLLIYDIPMTVMVDSPNTSTGKDIVVSFVNDVASY